MPSPSDVPEEKERKCAWVLYVVLISAFLGYVIWTIVDGFAQREDPPTSFEREEMVWNLPHIVAEGTRPGHGECTFALMSDDDDAPDRECRVEFFPDEESEDDEGVLVFFLGDFNIEAMRDEYEEARGDDDPEFDQSFVEGFVELGFEEVGSLWEAPIGLCAAQQFPAEEDRNYESITDACPISTYIPIGAVEQGVASQAFASNFVLEAEVFRKLDGAEEYSYTSSVSSTIWNVPSGELDDDFSLLSAQPVPRKGTSSLALQGIQEFTHDGKSKKVSTKRRGRKHGHGERHSGPRPQQASTVLGYAGQVWVYQQAWTISVTEEQDPLDMLALFGLWGGAFTYVAIIFGLVFVRGKGGVHYSRFSKESKAKYQIQPASKRAKAAKDKKKKKKGKDVEDSEDDEDDEEGIEGMDV